jgi:serine/threonine protein kinase
MLTEPLSPNLFPVGTLLDAKFRVSRCIGRGGMGAVYEIQHVLTKHRRALKMLYPHVAHDRDAVDRFLREASAAGTIGNKHITETYDAGWLTTGEPYVLMELLEGESLHEWITSRQRLPLDEALLIVAQAATGVHAAHKAGIVHRDLKPENLFITHDESGRIFTKVLDFGVSKFDDGLGKTRATRDGAFMGTPQYMSPEQFVDGKTVDGMADVYSLGVILFECVTGKHPYPCDTLAQLARKIIVEHPPAPSTIRADIPPALDQILATALRKEPRDRYESALTFAQALDAVRTGGNLTLPHGSVWPSNLPPPLELATVRSIPPPEPIPTVVTSQPTKRSAHIPTPTGELASPSTPPPSVPASLSPGGPPGGHATPQGTVLLSTTTNGETVSPQQLDIPRTPRSTSPLLIAAMVAAVSFGGALAWWRSTSQEAAAAKNPPEAPALIGPGEAPEPSAQVAAAASASVPAVPAGTPAPAESSAQPSAKGAPPSSARTAPVPASAAKPPDHAGVDEFPE